jgi:D-aminoacyl-tRNA deacylase
MRALVQRVSEASVVSDGTLTGKIREGILLFAGFEDSDTTDDLEYIVRKVTNLRIFDDENGVMNLSLEQISGEILVVSQFTLHALTKKGNRPSYIRAAKPERAVPLYEKFISLLIEATKGEVECGVFGADMKVSLLNDGPVTIWLDSKNSDY